MVGKWITSVGAIKLAEHLRRLWKDQCLIRVRDTTKLQSDCSLIFPQLQEVWCTTLHPWVSRNHLDIEWNVQETSGISWNSLTALQILDSASQLQKHLHRSSRKSWGHFDPQPWQQVSESGSTGPQRNQRALELLHKLEAYFCTDICINFHQSSSSCTTTTPQHSQNGTTTITTFTHWGLAQDALIGGAWCSPANLVLTSVTSTVCSHRITVCKTEAIETKTVDSVQTASCSLLSRSEVQAVNSATNLGSSEVQTTRAFPGRLA